MRYLRKKVYEQYKIIGVDQIKGIGTRRYLEGYKEKAERAKRGKVTGKNRKEKNKE